MSETVDEIIDRLGLRQISDPQVLNDLIDSVISIEGLNPKSFNNLVGKVIKASKGKANPLMVTNILKDKLNGL